MSNGLDDKHDEELPGMMAVAKFVAEQRWPHTMDAKAWADEFVKAFPGIDHGTMLGWFANAIMAGYDTAQSRFAQSAGRTIRSAIAYLDASKETRVGLRFDDDTELDLPIADFLAWLQENFAPSHGALEVRAVALKYAAGEISAAKFGEELGLVPSELHKFKAACGAFQDENGCGLLRPAVKAHERDYSGGRPNKPMSLGAYERAASVGVTPSHAEHIPDALFNGYTVYKELRAHELTNMTPQHVSAVLDAVVRLLRRTERTSSSDSTAKPR
jgi:hypothetical protein